RDGAHARRRGEPRGRPRLDARRHAADGEGRRALLVETRTIGMEGSREAPAAELERRDAPRRESSRRSPRAGDAAAAIALIYCPRGPWVSVLPERPLVLLVEDD